MSERSPLQRHIDVILEVATLLQSDTAPAFLDRTAMGRALQFNAAKIADATNELQAKIAEFERKAA